MTTHPEAGEAPRDDSPPRFWRLPAPEPGGYIATDWDGFVIAHTVGHAPLAEVLEAAIVTGRFIDEVRPSLPGLVAAPVEELVDLETPSPTPARTTSGEQLPTVLRLSPFSHGSWLVETVSGSHHVLDLDRGLYTRLPSPEAASFVGVDHDWRTLLCISPWPAVNHTFGLQLLDPDDHPDGDVISLTSSWVTRITKLPPNPDLARIPDVIPLDDTQAIKQAPPNSAWILLADEASWPDDSDMADPDGIEWTSPKHAQRGDLVLLYFIAPHKAVCFAARVAEPPLYMERRVNALGSVDPHQWWCILKGITPVDPIPFRSLEQLFGGQLVLKGRPTTYVRPEIIDQLRHGQSDKLLFQTPTGRDELPARAQAVTLEKWAAIASGVMRQEVDVEIHIVEPMLTLIQAAQPGLSWKPKRRLGNLVPDYSIYLHGQLAALVEVKLGIRSRGGGQSWTGPDLDQIHRYCTHAKLPGLLIDATRVLLVDPSRPEPVKVFDRSEIGQAELSGIIHHLLATPA